LAPGQPAPHHLPADPQLRRAPPGRRQPAEPPAARTQRPVLPGEPPWRQRHLAPPPHPARADPRLVTPDGWHHRHHLGQQDNRPPQELDASPASRKTDPSTRRRKRRYHPNDHR